MTKEEYAKTLEKYAADKVADAKHDDYYAGYFDGLKKAIKLTKELDEPKKVVIPEFIANDIKYHKKHGSTLRGALGSAFDSDEESNVYYWFFTDDGDENVRKYISAWNNGYEVEKEPKYLVRVKGFKNHNEYYNEYYINYDCGDEIICLDDKYERNNFKTIFTKSWLKDNWPEYEAYNDAGLLEFEEAEDE
ncbi:DUF1642 domain-containing protein [Pediococcus pentosaceus]|jgi:hypothetical protein|uniref:DUF1642 domain-containing protein n=1 Tax=Pediococcus pentosaceus TaxID=1255 RepID=UPI00390664F6|nr:DUF1642 domain-containing protein [Pediococcus pentosaceus]